MSKSLLIVLGLLGSVVSGLAQTNADTPPHWLTAAKAIGKSGTLNADGSFRINLPRTDVTFKNANGMPIPADLGLATYIAFTGTEEKCLAVGDVAMLEPEIDSVFDKLRAGGFEIVSLHNHMTSESPRLFYTHFQVVGSSKAIAETFRSAIDVLGKRKATGSVVAKPGKPRIDKAALEAVFGTSAQVFPSGVIRFASPRKDLTVTVDDMRFLPGMGLASWVAMSSCECGMTMAMGDTCCRRSELQGAIDILRKAKIHVTAIHNHILGGSQEISFLHYEAEGDALDVAKTVKSCWAVLGK